LHSLFSLQAWFSSAGGWSELQPAARPTATVMMARPMDHRTHAANGDFFTEVSDMNKSISWLGYELHDWGNDAALSTSTARV
jgi:hypothetical protein